MIKSKVVLLHASLTHRGAVSIEVKIKAELDAFLNSADKEFVDVKLNCSDINEAGHGRALLVILYKEKPAVEPVVEPVVEEKTKIEKGVK